MKLIVDSNVLISALLKDSKTRELLSLLDNLYAPFYVLEEIESHFETIKAKAKLDEEQFNELFQILKENIEFIELSFKYQEKAATLVENIDPDDDLIVACCLAIKNSVLWSDDKALKKVKEIKVMNTIELVKHLQSYQ